MIRNQGAIILSIFGIGSKAIKKVKDSIILVIFPMTLSNLMNYT